MSNQLKKWKQRGNGFHSRPKRNNGRREYLPKVPKDVNPYTKVTKSVTGKWEFDPNVDYFYREEVFESVMTHNQIDYLNYVESKRTHQANEEIGRANVAVAQGSLKLEKSKWKTTKKNVKADTKKKKAETKNVKADTKKKKAEIKGIKADTKKKKAETKAAKANAAKARAEAQKAKAEAAAIPKQLSIALTQAKAAATQAAAAYKNASTAAFNAKVNATAQKYNNALKKADAKVRKAELKRLKKTLPSVLKKMKAEAKSAALKTYIDNFEHEMHYDAFNSMYENQILQFTKDITNNSKKESDKDLANYWLNKVIGGSGVTNIMKSATQYATKKKK